MEIVGDYSARDLERTIKLAFNDKLYSDPQSIEGYMKILKKRGARK